MPEYVWNSTKTVPGSWAARSLRLSYARRSAGWGDRLARTHRIATAAINSSAQNANTEITHSGKTTLHLQIRVVAWVATHATATRVSLSLSLLTPKIVRLPVLVRGSLDSPWLQRRLIDLLTNNKGLIRATELYFEHLLQQTLHLRHVDHLRLSPRRIRVLKR